MPTEVKKSSRRFACLRLVTVSSVTSRTMSAARQADSAQSVGQAMGNALGSMVKAVAAAAPGGGGLGGLPVQTGPSVRVTRGKVTTVEQAGR